MASFKRIRFFECDQIEDLTAAAANKAQPKGRVAPGQKEESKASTDPKERTIQDLQVVHMIYLDMFFLFLGREIKKGETPGSQPSTLESLFLTKNL